MTIHQRAQRDADAEFIRTLTHCAGTWLAQPPAADEIASMRQARQQLDRQRSAHPEPPTTAEALIALRQPDFAPIYLSDQIIAQILAQHGAPPVATDDDDSTFVTYVQSVIQQIATGRVRRALADQTARLLPKLVDAGKYREALAIEQTLFLTVMSNEPTALLVQALVGGLARWYETHDTES